MQFGVAHVQDFTCQPPGNSSGGALSNSCISRTLSFPGMCSFQCRPQYILVVCQSIAVLSHMYTRAFLREGNTLRRLKRSTTLDPLRTRATLSSRRTYVSRPNPNQTLKVWPFVFIFFAGTGAYVYMVKTRASEPQKPRGPSVTPK